MQIFVLFLIFDNVVGQLTILDQIFLPSLQRGREMMFEVGRTRNFDALYNNNLKMGKIQTPFPNSMPFPCNVNGPGARSKVPPNSVHKLTPGDIDVVAAIGDSLTTAQGVWSTDPSGVMVEGKGVSFAIGGQSNWRKFLTIPNILKEFNPNLYGYSVQDALSYKRESKFNAAETGAMTVDVSHQAKNLLLRMRGDPKVDFKHHWKLVTLFIGGNDFCLDFCYYQDQDRWLDKAEQDLTRTLRFVRDNFPRTMLNVISPPDVISLLLAMKGKPRECETTHYLECPCVFSLSHQRNLKRSMKTIETWKQRVRKIVVRPEFQEKLDFTVNLVPFVDNLKLFKNRQGGTDFSYFSYDCFHLSQKGHSIAANALWNNMLEPSGNKTNTWQKDFFINCPTYQRPFLSTNRNS